MQPKAYCIQDRSRRIITTSNLNTKLCISLHTVHFFCATSHLTFYTVQQKLKNFSPLPLLSPKFNRAYISFGYKTQWLSRSKRTKARLGVAKDTYLTKPADAQRIITSAVPINRSIHSLLLYSIVYNGDQPRETIRKYKLCGTRTHNQSILFIKGRYT